VVLDGSERATPMAWFVFDASDRLVFESRRASELAGQPIDSADVGAAPTVRTLAVDTARQARAGAGSAGTDGAIVEGTSTRRLRVEAQELVLDSGPATVVWVVELDLVDTMDEARQRIDELVDQLERHSSQRERLLGVLDAVVAGLDAGVVVVDRSLTVTDCSERAAALLRVPRRDIVGQDLAATGPVGRQLAPLVASCFDARPSHGVLEGLHPPVHAGCAAFDAGTAAVAVLQELSQKELSDPLPVSDPP
jgi:PAS domain-containing protein